MNYRKVIFWVIFIFVITIPLQIFAFIIYMDIAGTGIYFYNDKPDYKIIYFYKLDIFLRILLTVVTLFFFYSLRKSSKRILKYLVIIFIYIFLWIYISLFLRNLNRFINCNFGIQQKVKIEGVLIRKEKHDGYSRGNYFKYFLDVNAKEIELQVSKDFYSKYQISDTLKLDMIKGSRGIIYIRF